MQLVFRCLDDGKELYGVLRQGREIFVGTREECGRFLELHLGKVQEERENERRPHRLPPPRPRIFHVATPRAS